MAQPIQDMMSAGAFGANTAAMGNAGMLSTSAPVGAQQISSGGASDKPGLGTVAQLQQLDGFKRQTEEQNMMTAGFGAAAGANDRMRAQTTAISNAEEQAKWYSFLRWLKSHPSFSGETTSERLINFIDNYIED